MLVEIFLTQGELHVCRQLLPVPKPQAVT